MDATWINTVLLVPFVVVLTAGLFYVYGAVIGLLSKTSVRNKVVVITDALSGLGKGNPDVFREPCFSEAGETSQCFLAPQCRVLNGLPEGRGQAYPVWEELGETRGAGRRSGEGF